MRETPAAAAAFAEYCALGPDRSLRKLVDKVSTNLAQLGIWSRNHSWQERVAQYDIAQIKERERKKQADIEKMNERHAQIGITQQARAIKQIEELIAAKKFGSQASVQLLKLATDLERLARGEPTERTAVKGDISVEGFKELLMQRVQRLEEQG